MIKDPAPVLPPNLAALTALGEAAAEALAQCPDATYEMFCAMVEDGRAGYPMPFITEIEDDANWWASLANTIELEAYFNAITARLGETAIHGKARKRLIARLFLGMQPRDQDAFLAWVATKKEEAVKGGAE